MNTVLNFLGGIFGSFVTDWQAKRQNQRDIEKAVTDNKIRMALSAQDHNKLWEMRALENKDNFLRRLSFLMWSSPMIWALVDPVGTAIYFKEALSALPDWYVAGYLGMTGAVWGLSELKSKGIIK